MVTARLEVQGLNIPIDKDIPVSITYVLADVRESDKRSASFSKTIQIPESSVINKFFENFFEVNISTQVFNKNLKTPVKYFVNDIQNFKGDLQLTKIVISKTGLKTYECVIKGEGGSLFLDIGDKLITGNPDPLDDLDFSEYNHTYNRATQISTRSNYGTGLGVLYPFIDKGSNGGVNTVFSVEDFLPCFSKYEYVKKIIEKAGYTYTSSILESTEFKKQITYPNLQSVVLSQSQLANRQFYVGLTTDANITGVSIPILNLNNETGNFFDAGSQCAGTSCTLNDSGEYNLATHQVFEFKFTHTDPTVTRVEFDGYRLQATIQVSYDGGSSWTVLTYAGFYFNNAYSNLVNINTAITSICEVATGATYKSAGTKFRVDARYTEFPSLTRYYNASNVQITSGTGTLTVKLLSGNSGTSFYCLATGKSVVAGNAIEVNNALPQKLKQRDYFKSIIQALNLYIDIDKNDPKHLIIESYNEFYNGDIINWMDPVNKVDLDKEQTINPNLLDAKNYVFTYKDDGDYYNKLYKETYGEVFGTETVTIENDFQKSDKKNEIIFSATPNVANYDLGIAIPIIVTIEGLTKKPFTPNVRWLFVGGVKQSATPYTYKETGQADLITSDYLYAGHTDDPFNPTVDLNFGVLKETYYSYINAYFTNNNLYNRFQKNSLLNITDRDSKFCTKYIWVNALDINQFSFRNRYYIDFAYYIVNKIEDYNPQEEKSVKFELIKLLRTETFSPSSFLISDMPNMPSGNGVSSTVPNSSFKVGNNIQNKGINCIAIGENIVIPQSASNVTVIGNNVVVAEGVSNSSVINTNNYNLEQSNFSITNNFNSDEYFLDGSHTTTDDSPSEIEFNTINGLFDMQGIDVVIRAEIRILAVDVATGDCKEWKGARLFKNIGGSTSTGNIETITSVYADTSMAACTANFYDDFTPPSIECGIQGLPFTTIVWKCYVNFLRTII